MHRLRIEALALRVLRQRTVTHYWSRAGRTHAGPASRCQQRSHLIACAPDADATTVIAPNGQASIRLYNQCSAMASRRYAHASRRSPVPGEHSRGASSHLLMAGRGRGRKLSLLSRIRGTKSAVVTAALFCCSGATLRRRHSPGTTPDTRRRIA